MSNTILLQAALWHENTKLALQSEFRDMSPAAFTVSSNHNKKVDDIDLVDAYSLSYLVSKYNMNKIDILKMDIEGAEKEIMTNNLELSDSLPLCRFVAIEVYEEIIKEDVVINILEKYNFSVSHSGEYLIAQQNILD